MDLAANLVFHLKLNVEGQLKLTITKHLQRQFDFHLASVLSN